MNLHELNEFIKSMSSLSDNRAITGLKNLLYDEMNCGWEFTDEMNCGWEFTDEIIMMYTNKDPNISSAILTGLLLLPKRDDIEDY